MRKRTSRFARATLAVFAALLATSSAESSGPQPNGGAAALAVPTIDQSLSVEEPGGGRLSPEGGRLVYEVTRPDWDSDRFVTELWVVSTRSGERFPLTAAGKWSGNPRWSPDGKWIAFRSDRAGSNQVFLISPDGGEARQLTNAAEGVNAFRWSPDGKRIAYSKNDPEPEALKKRRDRYGDFTVVDADQLQLDYAAMNHLWAVETAQPVPSRKFAEPVRLTGGTAFTVTQFEWSPDGRSIAFSAPRDATPKARSSADIYLLEVGSGSVRKLVDTPGPDTYPVWSPDGRQIAYETANGSRAYFETNTYIAVVDREGGKPRLLTDTIDEQASLLAWAPRGIYFALLQRTNIHLFRLDPATKRYERVSSPAAFSMSAVSFDRAYRNISFLRATATSYPEFQISSVEKFQARRLTRFNDQLVSFIQPSRELVSWRSSDGATVEGVLIKPADFDPSRKYPLLVIVHGGPADFDQPLRRSTYAYPVDQLVAKGAIILRPNYRGSVGYGEAFRAPDPRTLSDYDDVISGVRHLVELGLADRGRIGVMGWSQGGYLAALLATKGTAWFKAASVGAGVPNWLVYYANGDAGYWAAEWFKATPLQDPAVYRLKSPINYVDGMKTAVLIQHGEFDHRAPVAGAYEFYQALKDRQVPAKLIIYKGAGHGVGTPKGQRALMEHNLEWFSRWLWEGDGNRRH